MDINSYLEMQICPLVWTFDPFIYRKLSGFPTLVLIMKLFESQEGKEERDEKKTLEVSAVEHHAINTLNRDRNTPGYLYHAFVPQLPSVIRIV